MPELLNLDLSSLGLIVLRTFVVYAVLLLGLRLAGKRELGQMTAFDFVVVLVISNAVQNAMVGPDTSLTGGLVAAATLLLANHMVGLLGLHSPWLEQRVVGSPVLLIHEGILLNEHLIKEGITQDEVVQALREHGVEDVQSVKLAVLEVDGTISVIPAAGPFSRTSRRIRARKLRC